MIELERDGDRWIADVLSMPGVMVYGKTRAGAVVRVLWLALSVWFWRAVDDWRGAQ